MDVLVDKSGRVTSLIVGVGGFLGAGEKDVAVPSTLSHSPTKDNNKWPLVMNTAKDELKSASGFTYDKNATTWVPDKNNARWHHHLHGFVLCPSPIRSRQWTT